mmetsp:Transcript_26862/g.83106  ORF Transcript_26862/g.83106 Transcript_26862/m.83106 type:complete len:216 (+) Transcript_26862:234-881(+)
MSGSSWFALHCRICIALFLAAFRPRQCHHTLSRGLHDLCVPLKFEATDAAPLPVDRVQLAPRPRQQSCKAAACARLARIPVCAAGVRVVVTACATIVAAAVRVGVVFVAVVFTGQPSPKNAQQRHRGLHRHDVERGRDEHHVAEQPQLRRAPRGRLARHDGGEGGDEGAAHSVAGRGVPSAVDDDALLRVALVVTCGRRVCTGAVAVRGRRVSRR